MRARLFLFLAAAIGCGGVAAPPSNTPQEIAYKRAHLARCLDELARRDVADLTPAQRDARSRSLAALKEYADGGVFPQNTEHPGREIPYLIDAYGTRCALAHLIDASGHDALLQRLAARDNHAYVASFMDDAEFAGWLGAQGLSVEEVAFVQGPGFVSDSTPIDFDPPPPERPETPPDHGHDIEVPTGQAGITPAGPPDTATRTRRGGGGAAAWEQWWFFHRASYVNLRQRYHDRIARTGASRARPRRLTDEERAFVLLPFLAQRVKEDEDARATALMAWARASRPEDGPQVVAATLAYLADGAHRYRDLVLLALGVVKDGSGVPHLREILGDTGAGRRLLGAHKALSERTRAAAAIALGQAGDAAAIDDLLAVLAKERHAHADLGSACVTALGLLAARAEPERRDAVAGVLLDTLKDGRRDDAVRAAVPAALAKSGSPVVLEDLALFVERFRDPQAVRRSCALALGLAAPYLSHGIVDDLMAAARRDPDPAARRFAILALGELCARDRTEKLDPELRNKVTRFYSSALNGYSGQPEDLEWLYLSAALFARRFTAYEPAVADHLLDAARTEGAVDRRCAAVAALGILGSGRVQPELSRLFEAARDAKLRGYLAEALGILGDRGARDALVAMTRTDPSDDVRYHAALGLGFLADTTAVKGLVDALAETRSQPARAALTRAIGEIGDRATLPALMDLALSDDLQSRERALGALGLLGDDADEGWPQHVRHDLNFLDVTPTLRQVLLLF